jgi:hypothetical protein
MISVGRENYVSIIQDCEVSLQHYWGTKREESYIIRICAMFLSSCEMDLYSLAR